MEDDLITIAVFSHSIEAEVAKNFLDSAEIPSFVFDGHTVTMNWLYSNAIGGVKLKVRREDVHKAQELLSKDYAAELQEVVDDSKYAKCPLCGNEDSVRVELSRAGFFISFLLLGFPFLFARKRFKCNSCGHNWRI